MDKTLEEELHRVVDIMNGDNTNGDHSEPPQPEPEETYHIYPVEGGIFITQEELPEDSQVVASTPPSPKQAKLRFDYLTLCIVLICCIPMLASIIFQVFEVLNPPIATITIIPKSQTISFNGTLQLGRVLSPLTISQSQTAPTTGKGHQDAKKAQGAITFYNGLFTSQTIAAGTILTGTSGIQVVTDQDASIPAANPPIFGQVTISAHAINPGVRGNIPSYDINQACCSNAVLAKNTQPFSGGADERTYQTVSKADIANIATPLKTEVAQSMSGALQGQVKPPEQLFIFPCTPTVTSDHNIGTEATQVKITVAQTCSAVAYNREALAERATALLSTQAATKSGAGYSLIGAVTVSVTQATRTATSPPLVFLSFHARGTWIYGLSQKAQEQIKRLIAGKTKQAAMQILRSLPEIAQASINWTDDSRLPKNTRYIHLTIFVV
jgi:hypothetical protein